MKEKWYGFNYRDSITKKYIAYNSFRDRDYDSARLQAEVYRDKLAYYNPDISISVTREYGGK